MENVELELKKKFDKFERDKVQSLKKLDLEVTQINKNLSTFIDDIYQ